MKLIDKADDFTTKMDKFIERYLPHVICFTAGYFLGIIVRMFQ